MIVCTSASADREFVTTFDNGAFSGPSDTTADKGGSGLGFRPHELLEAALGDCMAITARMYAKKYGLALESVRVTVDVDRSQPDRAEFVCSMQLAGDLTERQREKIVRAAENCPVRKTLSRRIGFRNA